MDGLWVAVGQPWVIERERFAGPATSSDPLLEELLTLTEPMKCMIVHFFRIVYPSVTPDS